MPDEMMAAYLIDPSLITETRRYYVYVTPEMAEAIANGENTPLAKLYRELVVDPYHTRTQR
jgi:hypothetical protein